MIKINLCTKVQQKNEIRKEKRKKITGALAYMEKKLYLCNKISMP